MFPVKRSITYSIRARKNLAESQGFLCDRIHTASMRRILATNKAFLSGNRRLMTTGGLAGNPDKIATIELITTITDLLR